MRKIIHWVGGAGLALALSSCGILDARTSVPPRTGPPIVITQDALPSALVTVVDGTAFGPGLPALVHATAQPLEDLAVLQAGTPPTVVLSSGSPAPPTVVVAGKPAVPGADETTYAKAQYAAQLKHWSNEVAAGRDAEASREHDALSTWVRGLGLHARLGALADRPGPASSLVAEATAAASALAGLEEEKGNAFGARRVLLLYSNDLAGRLPAGELAGDIVVVITTFLPSSAAASAAQVNLLAAGAAQAAVTGPEVTGPQLAALVSAGLGQDGMHESVSAPVLFGNDSAALSPNAIAQLTALLTQLRRTPATLVINGYASTPGTALTNYLLSYERASNVAFFFESHGLPGSSVVIVGHGTSDLVASGGSGQNRRVVVVIEKPA